MILNIFLPDQHKKEKKKVETWKANYSKYRGASLFTEIPNKIYWHENYNPTLQMLLFSRVDTVKLTREKDTASVKGNFVYS